MNPEGELFVVETLHHEKESRLDLRVQALEQEVSLNAQTVRAPL